jgi:hypothetical protein
MKISRAGSCLTEHLQGQSTRCSKGASGAVPRIWPLLPVEQRRQLAQQIGALIQRLREAQAREPEEHRAEHDDVL